MYLSQWFLIFSLWLLCIFYMQVCLSRPLILWLCPSEWLSSVMTEPVWPWHHWRIKRNLESCVEQMMPGKMPTVDSGSVPSRQQLSRGLNKPVTVEQLAGFTGNVAAEENDAHWSRSRWSNVYRACAQVLKVCAFFQQSVHSFYCDSDQTNTDVCSGLCVSVVDGLQSRRWRVNACLWIASEKRFFLTIQIVLL